MENALQTPGTDLSNLLVPWPGYADLMDTPRYRALLAAVGITTP